MLWSMTGSSLGCRGFSWGPKSGLHLDKSVAFLFTKPGAFIVQKNVVVADETQKFQICQQGFGLVVSTIMQQM